MSSTTDPRSSVIDNDSSQTPTTWPPTGRLSSLNSGSPYQILNQQDDEQGHQQSRALPSSEDSTGSENDIAPKTEAPVTGRGLLRSLTRKSVPHQKTWYSKISCPIKKFATVVKAALDFAWVAEVLSCSVAILSLLAIVIVTRSHEGQPLPSWPLGISINALVAIFATLLKVGLTVPLSEGISQLKWQWFSEQPRSLLDMHEFDSASRGPWGSFLFLLRSDSPSDNSWTWTQLRRHFIWQKSQFINSFAKISSILILLVFAIDPFTQQIVQNVPCLRDSPEMMGRVPRSNTYFAHGMSRDSAHFPVDQAMASAFDRGIVNPPSDMTSLLPFECPTGNCTIPSFSTIGLCHTCQDVTHLLEIKQIVSVIPYKAYVYDKLELEIADDPNSIKVLNTIGDFVAAQANGLMRFKMIALPLSSDGTPYSEPVAYECTLQPCLRTYQANIRNSVLNETEVGRSLIGLSQFREGDLAKYEQRNSSVDPGEMFYVLATTKESSSTSSISQNSSIIVPGGQQSCVGSENPGPGLVKVPVDNIDAAPTRYNKRPSDYKDGVPVRWLPQPCVWGIGFQVYDAITLQLDGLLSVQDVRWIEKEGVTIFDPIPRRLYNDGSLDFNYIDGLMRNLSDTMTATMRSHGGTAYDSAGEYATGPASQLLTCISVGWEWISYPAALVGLTTLWLAVMVWQSPRNEMRTRGWKSSSLPILLAGVSDEKINAIKSSSGGLEQLFDTSRTRMEELVASVDAQLVRDGNGHAKFV
ncbi:hypothetical protein F4680DRAFT_437615 [Xylaria scruposa]|nr:hypothetical protein F4680DRAFT_437615 [Xylaria scruposa]